jgi:hypothetical protein
VTADGSGYSGIRAGQSRKSPSPLTAAESRRSKGHLPGLSLPSRGFARCGEGSREGPPRTSELMLRKVSRPCCKGSCASVESPVAGPRARNDEWAARDDGGPSVRTRVEPEGHRRAPPPVLKAPRRRMWGFSLPLSRSGSHRSARDSATRRSPDGGRRRRYGPRAASAPRSPRFPHRTRPPGR